jgi:uncharacterized protein
MRPVTYLFVTLFAATTAVAQIGASGAAAQGFPKATGRVNDFANVIDPATEAEIDRRLDQLERDTSSEIAVATVQSLDGTSVEDYANRLFKEWGVGQAGADNGVLVLVAIDDRAMKIEVGYGLEGILPDGLAGQVIRDEFTPRFRDNDYSGGIRNGVNRLADIVEKQQVLTAEELAAFNDEASTTVPSYILIPFIAIFVGIGFMLFGAGIRTKTIFPLLFGGFFGGMPLLLALLVSFLPAVLILVPFAVFMFIFGRRLGARPGWMASMRQEAEREAGSPVYGWKMGTTSSSSSSSSDDDSGSSSSSSSSSSSDFGGGSSGGGGASGRW